MAKTAPEHKGETSISWGTDEAETYGIIQNIRTSHEGSWAEAKDAMGRVVTRTLYDTADALTVTLLKLTNATDVKVGDVVTIDSVGYLCEGVVQTASNEAYTQLELTLRRNQEVSLA